MSDEFSRIYDEHVWDVYGFLGYRVAARADAEDLTQLTFERALQAWGRFDPERASARTWLLAIARNILIDFYRRREKRGETIDPDAEVEDAGAVVPMHDRPSLGVSPDLERALGTLAERDRELVALRYGGDLTGAEIAEMTGLSLANVQQILSRSLRRMREELDGQTVVELVG